MKITHLTATELKRKTREILNLVAFGETVAIVERYGEALVKIMPVKKEERVEIEETLKKYFGAIPNFPSISKTRHFRERNLNL